MTQTSGALRREIAKTYPAVEAISGRHCEERQRRSNPAFSFAAPKLDCFASLAMTVSRMSRRLSDVSSPESSISRARDVEDAKTQSICVSLTFPETAQQMCFS
jgi:hypothetical protein